MWQLQKVQETGDYSYLCPLRVFKNDFTDSSDKVFEEFNDDFIKLIGFDNQYKKVLELKKKYVSTMCKWLQDGNLADKMALKFIVINLKDAQNILNSRSKNDHVTNLIGMEKLVGRNLDTKKISVLKFHKMVEFYTKEVKND